MNLLDLKDKLVKANVYTIQNILTDVNNTFNLQQAQIGGIKWFDWILYCIFQTNCVSGISLDVNKARNDIQLQIMEVNNQLGGQKLQITGKCYPVDY